jgi:hypothetical protein
MSTKLFPNKKPEWHWQDNYLTAVAAQLDWWFASYWHLLEELDSKLSYGCLREILDQVESAGIPVEVGLINWKFENEQQRILVEPLLEELRKRLARVRSAGQKVFADPWLPSFHLACMSEWPLMQSDLPAEGDAMLNQIVLFDFSDFPKHNPEWENRYRIATLSNLEYLAYQGNEINDDTLGIDIDKLPKLRALDLERNSLRELPKEVLACRRLEVLKLYDNPDLGQSLDPEMLSQLGPLRLLDLRGTNIPSATLAKIKKKLPDCIIEI